MRFMGETPETISFSLVISQSMRAFWCFGNGPDFWGHVAGGCCGHLILISDNPKFCAFIILHWPNCYCWRWLVHTGECSGNWKIKKKKISTLQNVKNRADQDNDNKKRDQTFKKSLQQQILVVSIQRLTFCFGEESSWMTISSSVEKVVPSYSWMFQ